MKKLYGWCKKSILALTNLKEKKKSNPLSNGPIKAESPANKKPNTKYRKYVYKLVPGMKWNPLTSYPRNKTCHCGSGDKAKFCCLPFEERQVKI